MPEFIPNIKNLIINIKKLIIKMFGSSNCNNVPGDNNLIQKTSGFSIGNRLNNSITVNNHSCGKSDPTTKDLESLKKLIELFSERIIERIISQITDPRLHHTQPGAGYIKYVTNHFENIRSIYNAEVILDSKYRALDALRKFIDTKDSVQFKNDWIKIGVQLSMFQK